MFCFPNLLYCGILEYLQVKFAPRGNKFPGKLFPKRNEVAMGLIWETKVRKAFDLAVAP